MSYLYFQLNELTKNYHCESLYHIVSKTIEKLVHNALAGHIEISSAFLFLNLIWVFSFDCTPFDSCS